MYMNLDTNFFIKPPVRYGTTDQSGIDVNIVMKQSLSRKKTLITLVNKKRGHIILKILSELEVSSIRDLKHWLIISQA